MSRKKHVKEVSVSSEHVVGKSCRNGKRSKNIVMKHPGKKGHSIVSE